MNSMKQQGQTLGGMILGILIAVVILGGAFWYFSQQKAPFQSEVVTKEPLPVPEPEIIVPNDGLESILHKNPEEWITDGNDGQPEQPAKPENGGSKPEPDELGAFIEKDLAPKDNLIIDAKPEPKAEPAPPASSSKPADAKPAQAEKSAKAEKADKPVAEKKAAQVKEPTAAIKAGTLQAGAYRTEAQAEEQKVKLALLGYTANVVKADLGDKGIMYRVRMSVPDAKGTQTDLASKGVDVMVVR